MVPTLFINDIGQVQQDYDIHLKDNNKRHGSLSIHKFESQNMINDSKVNLIFNLNNSKSASRKRAISKKDS